MKWRDPSRSSGDRLLFGLVIVLSLAGAGLRIARWWSNQTLWLDEAMVAVNVRDGGFLGLLGNLRFSQSAPLGWLYGERLLVMIFGTDERVLRLLPLLYSLGTVAVAALIARRWLGPAGQVVLVTATAVAPVLVRYATEVKQYSAEAFWVLALVGLAAWAAERPSVRSWAWWWVIAAVASTQSMASVFVLPGLALILLVNLWRVRGRRDALVGAAFGGIWFAVFAVHYQVSLRHTTSTPYLTGYWRDFGGFPASYSPADMARWLVRLPDQLSKDPLGLPSSTLAAGFWLLVLAGVIIAIHRRPPLGWLLVTPILTGVLLGLAQAVPLVTRLALWLVPVLLVAAAVAIDAGVNYVSKQRATPLARIRVVATSVALAVFAAGFAITVVRQTASVARAPAIPFRADDRSAIEWLRQRHRPGDLTLVTISSYPSVAWYDPQRELAPGWYVRGVVPGSDCDPQRAKREVAGYQRLIVYSGIQVDTHLVIGPKLAELGRIVEQEAFDLAMVWVVELGAKADSSTTQNVRQEPNNCLAFSEL